MRELWRIKKTSIKKSLQTRRDFRLFRTREYIGHYFFYFWIRIRTRYIDSTIRECETLITRWSRRFRLVEPDSYWCTIEVFDTSCIERHSHRMIGAISGSIPLIIRIVRECHAVSDGIIYIDMEFACICIVEISDFWSDFFCDYSVCRYLFFLYEGIAIIGGLTVTIVCDCDFRSICHTSVPVCLSICTTDGHIFLGTKCRTLIERHVYSRWCRSICFYYIDFLCSICSSWMEPLRRKWEKYLSHEEDEEHREGTDEEIHIPPSVSWSWFFHRVYVKKYILIVGENAKKARKNPSQLSIITIWLFIF